MQTSLECHLLPQVSQDFYHTEHFSSSHFQFLSWMFDVKVDVFTYKKLSFLSLQIEASQHRRSALLIIYFHYNNSPDAQDDKTLLLAGNFFTENNSQPPYKDFLFWDMFLYVYTSNLSKTKFKHAITDNNKPYMGDFFYLMAKIHAFSINNNKKFA